MNAKKETLFPLFKGDRLLDIKEVSEVLNIDIYRIYCWIYERRIPYIKPGAGMKGPVKFDPHRLNKWLAERSRERIAISSFTIY